MSTPYFISSSSSSSLPFASTPDRPPAFRTNTKSSLRHPARSATCQSSESSMEFPSSPPRFGRLLGSVLGSPFVTTSEPLGELPPLNFDIIDGALSTVPHNDTVTRPPSPAPTMDFSMISPPSPTLSAIDVFGPATPSRSFYVTPHRRFYSSGSVGVYSGPYDRISPANPLKNILPRLWDVLSSPGKKGKGKSTIYDLDYNYGDLPPLDGEEGELIDDEACFVDVIAVTGIDIISLLPPEVALYLLLFLDLPSIIACLGVSKTWRALAEDNLVWRELFHQRKGWGVDLARARVKGWTPRRTSLEYGFSGSTSRLSHAIEEWGKRRLSLQSAINSPPRLSLLSRTSARVLLGNLVAEYMLDWRALYKLRFDLDKRWVSAEPKTMKISGHADSVYCLEFDSTRIITGSRDRTIKVWSLVTGRLLATFQGHAGSVLCLKFDKDWDVEDKSRMGLMVSGSSDCSVCVWDIQSTGNGVVADVRAVLKGHSGGVLDLKIDEQWIVSCSKDTVIRVWNRSTLELYCTLCGHEGPVNAVGLQSGRVVSASGDGTMILWDIESGDRLRTLEGHDRGLACIEFKDDYIVSGSNDCKIKVWSALSGECLRTLAGHDGLVRALSFNPTTNRLVSASYDRSVKVWDLQTGKLVREFKSSHVSHIFDVKFDVCRIISTSHDQKIVMLDFSQDLDTALFI